MLYKQVRVILSGSWEKDRLYGCEPGHGKVSVGGVHHAATGAAIFLREPRQISMPGNGNAPEERAYLSGAFLVGGLLELVAQREFHYACIREGARVQADSARIGEGTVVGKGGRVKPH